jgi:hypothetical protein
MRTHRWTLVPQLEAEFILGVRLASRHPVARSAVAWTVGLAAIVRVLSGHAAPDHGPSTIISLAGLLAAAATPPLFVRGGPLEALRWTRGRLMAACLARLHGAVALALVGAGAAAVVLVGRSGLSPGLAGAALLHAVLVGSLAGALAPRAGCAFATVCAVLMVAAGAGMAESGAAVSAPDVWAPPGALAARMLAGGGGHLPLTGWTALGALALWSLARGARPVTTTLGGVHARV